MKLGLLSLLWCSHALAAPAALPAQPSNQKTAHAEHKNEASNLKSGKLAKAVQPMHAEQKNQAANVPKSESAKEHAEHKKEVPKVPSTELTKSMTSHLEKKLSPAVKSTPPTAPVAKPKDTSKSVSTKHKKDEATAKLVTELAAMHQTGGRVSNLMSQKSAKAVQSVHVERRNEVPKVVVGHLGRHPASTSQDSYVSALAHAQAGETEAERQQKVDHALDVSQLAIEGADSGIDAAKEEAANAHMIAHGTAVSNSVSKSLKKWFFNPLPKLATGFENMFR